MNARICIIFNQLKDQLLSRKTKSLSVNTDEFVRKLINYNIEVGHHYLNKN